MAIQWMDDFSSYGTDVNRSNRLLDGVYASVTRFDLQADPDPTSGGGQVLRGFGGGLGGDIRKALSSGQTTVGIASRLWCAALPSVAIAGMCPHVYKDASNNVHITIMVNPSGYLEVYRDGWADSGHRTLLGTTSSPVISANSWKHIESKVVFDATAGSVELRVEGIQVLLLTGIRTLSNVSGAGTTCSMVASNSPQDSSQPAFYLKDFIVWDGSGTVNNTFMGSCLVYKIVPQSDSALSWNTSSGLTGYNLINDSTPDDDTNYISAPYPLPASPSSFNLTDLPANTSSVRGVMVIHRSRKTDGGDGNLQASVISGANTGLGTDRPITTAYTYWWDIFDKDPSGSSWSKTLVNALKLQLNRTT